MSAHTKKDDVFAELATLASTGLFFSADKPAIPVPVWNPPGLPASNQQKQSNIVMSSSSTASNDLPKPSVPSQQTDNERKTVLREKITALEAENKELYAQLRYQELLKQENERQQAEIERLRKFEQSFTALETEFLCAKRAEQVATEAQSVLELELKNVRDLLEDDKRDLMYRLEDSETARVRAEADLQAEITSLSKECSGLREANLMLSSENKDLQGTISRQAEDLRIASENRDAKAVQCKLNNFQHEITRLKSANSTLMAKNVQLQKGADGHGPKVFELKSQIETLKRRLDKQMLANRNLALSRTLSQDVDSADQRSNVAVECRDSTTRSRSRSSSQDECLDLHGQVRETSASDSSDPQAKAYDILAHKFVDVLSRVLDYHMPSISMSFEMLKKSLVEAIPRLMDDEGISESQTLAMKNIWVQFLQTQYTRIRESGKNAREGAFNM